MWDENQEGNAKATPGLFACHPGPLRPPPEAERSTGGAEPSLPQTNPKSGFAPLKRASLVASGGFVFQTESDGAESDDTPLVLLPWQMPRCSGRGNRTPPLVVLRWVRFPKRTHRENSRSTVLSLYPLATCDHTPSQKRWVRFVEWYICCVPIFHKRRTVAVSQRRTAIFSKNCPDHTPSTLPRPAKISYCDTHLNYLTRHILLL
jgi:hypothetical protein